MRVDIDGFVVQLEQTLEGCNKRIRRRAIMSLDEMIVLSPGGELIVIEEEAGDRPPSECGIGFLNGQETVEGLNGCRFGTLVRDTTAGHSARSSNEWR